MTTMIGMLRDRLKLQARQRTADEGGGASIGWVDAGEVYARMRPLAGREIVSADGLTARVTHEIWIRMRSDVEPQMRFVTGTRVLNIHAVLDVDGRRRWLRCLCEERVP